MLSDTQKQNLSAIAKGRSRDSKGRLLPTATVQESGIEELEAEVLTLSNALNESRKISQEREKQLTEEKRLHRLSKMSDANARGILQHIRDYLGGDRDESALAKVERLYRECIDRGTAYEVAAQDRDVARRERNEAVAEAQAARIAETAQESRIAELQAKLSEVSAVAEARVSRSYTEGTVMTLIISFAVAVISFFVGRWAR